MVLTLRAWVEWRIAMALPVSVARLVFFRMLTEPAER